MSRSILMKMLSTTSAVIDILHIAFLDFYAPVRLSGLALRYGLRIGHQTAIAVYK